MAQALVEYVSRFYLGRRDVVETAVATLLAGGHLLLVGPVGSGKTTMAKALAKAFGGSFGRVQMTNETLPSDILGYGVYAGGEVRVVKGPIFNNVVLIDEINRGPPRTLSALLEVMQEGQATIEGVAYKLPQPHMIIATMNLQEVRAGATQPLPYALQDRFLASVYVDYAGAEAERAILLSLDRLESMDGAPPPRVDVQRLVAEVRGVYVDGLIVDYVLNLVETVRRDERVLLPLSTRAPIALVKLARAFAYLAGRRYVVPDDVKRAAVYALGHRVVLREEYSDVEPRRVVEEALSSVEPPVYVERA